MSIAEINGYHLRKAIIIGANELVRQKALIDSLNVFPVPDGDTGTNMSLTVLAAAREVEKLNTDNIYEVAKAASNGSLRGARGNSGVIVSQLFRGFSKGLEQKRTANADDLANAFTRASETAYKAVMKPKEGTILTMARELGEKAEEMTYETEDLCEIMQAVIKHGENILVKTKDMLPQLKQAGVVDAGAKGILCFLVAALKCMEVEDDVSINDSVETQKTDSSALAASAEEIKFAYCTEFFILTDKTSEATETELKNYLNRIGDSIVVVCDEGIIKVHVHSNNPGLVIERALKIGMLDSIKIENMKQQHTNSINFLVKPAESAEKKNIGFVVISSGSGISEVFKCLGADETMEGGQTMNPSTEDILEAVKKVNAENVIILPNNKNIVLAAQQAVHLCEDKKLYVIPSHTIPQGMAALVNYVPINSVEDNLQSMESALGNVKSGSITFAVRDTVIDDKEIHEGDILCMEENKIKLVAGNSLSGAKALLDSMIEDNGEFINVFYGHETTKEEADELYDYIIKNHPSCEIEMEWGGQPLYHYIFSVE